MTRVPSTEIAGLGARSAVPRVRPTVDLRKLPLTADQAYVLSRVDGHTSLGDIVLLCPLPEAQTTDILRDLARAGVVEVPRPKHVSPPRVGAPPPPRFTGGHRGDRVLPPRAPGAEPRESPPAAHEPPRPPAAHPRVTAPPVAPRPTPPNAHAPSSPPTIRPPGAAGKPASAAAAARPTAAAVAKPATAGTGAEPTATAPPNPAAAEPPPTARPPADADAPPRAPTAPASTTRAINPSVKRAAAAAVAAPVDAPSEGDGIELSFELRGRIDEALGLAAKGEPYRLLGLSPDAEKGDVRRAYFRLAKEFHPDRYYGKQLGPYRPRLESLFAALTDAYNHLLGR